MNYSGTGPRFQGPSNDTYGFNEYFNEYDREQKRIECRCKKCVACKLKFDPMDTGGIRFWSNRGYMYVCSDCAENLEDLTEEDLLDGVDYDNS